MQGIFLGLKFQARAYFWGLQRSSIWHAPRHLSCESPPPPPRDKLLKDFYKYFNLVYTKTVDSVKRTRWLARQTPNILHYLPPSNSGKMASRFASVASEEIIQN